MTHLDTENRLSDPDGFYEALIAMHHELSEAQSQQVNARLILLLSNQIGDCAVLYEAMQRARAAVATPSSPPASTASTESSESN